MCQAVDRNIPTPGSVGRSDWRYCFDLFDIGLNVRIVGVSISAAVPSLGPLIRAGARFQAAHLGMGMSRSRGDVVQNAYVSGARNSPGRVLLPPRAD